MANHQVPTMFFFTGLIIGIIPYLLRISHFKSRFQVKHYAVLLLGIIILVIITLLNHVTRMPTRHLH